MKNFVQKGVSITLAAPANVDSGTPVLVGALFGVAAGTVASGENLDLVTQGVFDLPKLNAAAFSLGEKVYFDAPTGKCVEAGAGLPWVGVALAEALAGAVTVRVRLNHTPVLS